jgi:hypothetical protein
MPSLASKHRAIGRILLNLILSMLL